MTIAATRRATSEAETRLIGRALGALLRGGDVVLLEGALGAGKTTLVRAAAEGMGLGVEAVASPTFVVVHEYTRPGGAAGPRDQAPAALFHVDAYRLRGEDELESLGWDAVVEAIEAGRAAAVIEWPERLGAALDAFDPARVRLEHAGEESREIVLSIPSSWRSRPGLEDLLARGPTTCPVTGQPVPADSPTYPFANERARMADLHRWFSGAHTLSRDIGHSDLEEGL
ncbi:MAG: tRNA (adenosine(37)-N6)-threonylcarbamoyltransferase complex ATPase subunit type 1 TsaE [Phycisphaerales bacterium]